MNRTVAICALLVWVALWVALTAAAPWTLSDHNTFMKGFVNEQFLSFMGVIVTITLASAANLFVEVNKLEDRVDRPIFGSTKRHLKDSAFALIWSLVAAVVLVVAKPLVICGERTQAAVNGGALTVIIVSIMILTDLTQAAFALDLRADD